MTHIRWRVLGAFLAVTILVMLVLALVSGYALRAAFLDNLETDLAHEARGVVVALAVVGGPSGWTPAGDATPTGGVSAGSATPAAVTLEDFVRQTGTASGTRITVIAHDGTVLADSEDDPAAMENHHDRPEVIAALAGGEGRVRRLSATLKHEMLYVAVPTGSGVFPWSNGVVRVAVPASRVDPLLANVIRLPLLVGLLLLILMLLPAYFLARSFTRPIERLRTMAVEVAEGDLSYRVGLRCSDELGQLGEALNHMTAELQNRVSTLAAEKEQSAEILATMSDGVLVLDAAGVVVRVNTAAARMLGVSVDDMAGRPLVQAARSFAVQALAERALVTEGAATSEVRLPDERLLWVQAVPLGSRGHAEVLLLFRDETARRRAEIVRRDFVANVSHELKTPLAGLALLASTLRGLLRSDASPTVRDGQAEDKDERVARSRKLRAQRRTTRSCRRARLGGRAFVLERTPASSTTGATEDANQAEKFAERLVIEVGRLTDLVSDLLALSRLEEPAEAAREVEAVDLAAIARTVVDELRPQSEAMQRSLEFEAATPVRVRGDSTQLATLIRNLVENALRYNHPDGHVWVAVRQTAGNAQVIVRDDGLGIPRQEQARIFERFYRVDKARSRETGGTGLGLSIVKHVAEGHGGSVQVESTVGVGSTFAVTLPATPA